MDTPNSQSYPRNMHGRYASRGYEKENGRCYFNPSYETQQLPQGPFRYLFPTLARETFDRHSQHPDVSALLAAMDLLADHMVDGEERSGELIANNTRIPAGFTYFGQFIDHDISAGTSGNSDFVIALESFEPEEPSQVEVTLENQRTPTFDLDSVYGGPGSAYQHFPHFYQEEDPILFKIGSNEVVPVGELPNPELEADPSNPSRDLPRLNQLTQVPQEYQGLPLTTAVIGDLRNDENLIIAQFHLAFLKAHNRIVMDLRGSSSMEDEQVFLTARAELTKVYQWLVLHTFLPSILSPSQWNLLLDGFPPYTDKKGLQNQLFMPLEFATAAYRFGHSMVRNLYDFNRNFGRGNLVLERSTLMQLFEFTGKGAVNNPRFGDTLPHNWVIEWDRFFKSREQVDNGGQFFEDRFARPLDTQLATALTTPGMENEAFEQLDEDVQASVRVSAAQFNGIMKHLARRNLRRGYLFNIPSGQDIIAKLREEGIKEFTALTENEVLNGLPTDLRVAMREQGLASQTPLWFYILKEAEIQESGQHLGQLGSWLVGQTLIWLIAHSPISVIQEEWTPSDSLIPDLQSLSSVMDLMVYARVAPAPSPAS